MVIRMVSVGAPNHTLGRTKHSGNVVDGHTKLEEHSSACVPKDVRRDITAKASKVAGSTPSSALLRGYWTTGVFNDVRRC